jgi:hypothetical protein
VTLASEQAADLRLDGPDALHRMAAVGADANLPPARRNAAPPTARRGHAPA